VQSQYKYILNPTKDLLPFFHPRRHSSAPVHWLFLLLLALLVLISKLRMVLVLGIGPIQERHESYIYGQICQCFDNGSGVCCLDYDQYCGDVAAECEVG
jgi:hypothetical protein